MGHKGPVRRSTHIDEIPFLAVARSLGDLWSYNSEENVFVVSPEPDIRVYPVDIARHRCLVLGTDGAWNMLTPQNAISTVCQAEKANEQHMLGSADGKTAWINPSKQLVLRNIVTCKLISYSGLCQVDCAIERWNSSRLRADNTSVVTVMLDPPGPPRAQVNRVTSSVITAWLSDSSSYCINIEPSYTSFFVLQVLKNRKRELAALNAGQVPVPDPLQPGSVALVTNTTPDLEPEPGPVASQDCGPHPGPAARPASPARTGENIVQCNEISSSEDSSPGLGSDSEVVPAPAPPARTPRSLARELNSLKLSSPPARPRPRPGRQPRTGLAEVEQRCQALHSKLEAMERKVAGRAAQLAAGLEAELGPRTRSAERADQAAENRALRPRAPAAQQTPRRPGLVGRKRVGSPAAGPPPRKSPRTAVASQKPIVTRSRQATVLKLKKRL